jgi:phosphoribosyl-ATP pyrophosphohydrolase/phosphoribosyl-AMP cyclohydrolase
LQTIKTNHVNIDYSKHPGGLVPAIVQDDATLRVLMLGYMNEASLARTMETGRVTFFSRSKGRLWTKGEESGHYLELRSMALDCDRDALLVKAHPVGPVCHTGADTCWDEKNRDADFLSYLEDVIDLRRTSGAKGSYVASLFSEGERRIAQKVGEEAVEMVIESMGGDRDRLLNEAADLIFHYLVLLNSKGIKLQEVKDLLKQRHSK